MKSTINHQPSTINYFLEQQTTNNEQLSVINHQPSTVIS